MEGKRKAPFNTAFNRPFFQELEFIQFPLMKKKKTEKAAEFVFSPQSIIEGKVEFLLFGNLIKHETLQITVGLGNKTIQILLTPGIPVKNVHFAYLLFWFTFKPEY